MSMLTYLIDAKIRDDRDTIIGKTMGRPTLRVTDGENITWSVDVDVGIRQPAGEDEVGLIGDWSILRNVPISTANVQVRYADTGAPVLLKRTEMGRWQIVGFSKELPENYTRYTVTLPKFDFGIPEFGVSDPIHLGLETRTLTYGELATVGGGYGTAAYGSVGVYRGGELIRVQI